MEAARVPDRLDTYRAKRDPGRTPEPFGPPGAGAKQPARVLSFVVQKHAARRLHWDFRLELGGTLRSWAVPKGPSADPADRRLAVEVEDHPLEYAGFEGIIPSGNYGAGAVIVWDRGTWTPEGDAERGLRDGKLVFRLDGEKLRGEWTLVRTRPGAGGKADWLLMKHRGDAFAGPGRPFGEASVISGRTLEEVAQGVAAPARVRRREPRAPSARAPVEVTHPEKVLFPADGITKGELVAYHRTIAPLMLPYLAGRPVVVTRFPDGIAGRSFVQRDAPEWSPAWMRTAAAPSDERGRDLRHFLVDDADGLAWLVNLGVIPIHVMASRASSPDRPDWCVVGLEPAGAPFSDVIRLARALHALCEASGLPAYPKTTGLGGLHVLVPLGGQLSHEQARTLGELLVRAVEARHPGLSTTRRAGSPRGARVRLDPLQNGRGRTVTAPYTVAGRAGAPVSTPLRWSEVTARLDPSRFTLRNVPRRAERLADDPLRAVLTRKPDLAAALERLREALAGPGGRGRRAARTSGSTRG